MPASIDAATYAQIRHFSDSGNKIAQSVMAIIDGTYIAATTVGAGLAASVTSSGNTSFGSLPTTTLVVKRSIDGGSTFPATRTHTWGSVTDIDSIVTELRADTTFLGGGTPDIAVSKSGSELVLTSLTLGTNIVLKVDSSSTGLGSGKLHFTSNQLSVGSGVKLSFQITNKAGHRLSGVKQLIVRALAVAGTAAFVDGGAGDVLKGSGTAEVWCATDTTGLLELNFTDATSEDILIKAQADNGEVELNKVTTPLP